MHKNWPLFILKWLILHLFINIFHPTQILATDSGKLRELMKKMNCIKSSPSDAGFPMPLLRSDSTLSQNLDTYVRQFRNGEELLMERERQKKKTPRSESYLKQAKVETGPSSKGLAPAKIGTAQLESLARRGENMEQHRAQRDGGVVSSAQLSSLLNKIGEVSMQGIDGGEQQRGEEEEEGTTGGTRTTPLRQKKKVGVETLNAILGENEQQRGDGKKKIGLSTFNAILEQIDQQQQEEAANTPSSKGKTKSLLDSRKSMGSHSVGGGSTSVKSSRSGRMNSSQLMAMLEKPQENMPVSKISKACAKDCGKCDYDGCKARSEDCFWVGDYCFTLQKGKTGHIYGGQQQTRH